MKSHVWTFSVFFILMLVLGSGRLYSKEDPFLEYPYVASGYLQKEFDADTISRFESLTERLIRTMNQRIRYRKTENLFLDRSEREEYIKATLDRNPEKKLPGVGAGNGFVK
jgi:hypothetical protein